SPAERGHRCRRQYPLHRDGCARPPKTAGRQRRPRRDLRCRRGGEPALAAGGRVPRWLRGGRPLIWRCPGGSDRFCRGCGSCALQPATRRDRRSHRHGPQATDRLLPKAELRPFVYGAGTLINHPHRRPAAARGHLPLALLAILCSSAAVADNLVVTSAADSGPGTLRAALLSLWQQTPPHHISIEVPGDNAVLTLESPLPFIDGPETTISGANSPGFTIDGGGQHAIIRASPGLRLLELSDLR